MIKRVISSESVFDGHPDKICDRISDEILDAVLSEDKLARVAIEAAINTVYLFGEITTMQKVDYDLIFIEHY